MLRRRLLTAAIAAPGLMLGERVAASCGTPIIEGIGTSGISAGSSVPPLGRVPRRAITPRPRFDPWGGSRVGTQSCGPGGGYTEPYLTQEQWWLAFYNVYSIYAGARPLPAGTVEVDEATAIAMRNPNGSQDHSHLSPVLRFAAHVGEIAGATFGGPLGAAAGGLWSQGLTMGITVIDARWAYFNNQQRAANSQFPSTPSNLFYLNGQMSAYVPGTGVYAIPSISPPGGGGGFCIPTYLLL